MLRGAAGVEFELGLEVSDSSFAVAEEFENADPHRMAEHPEELGFDDVDGVRAHVSCAGIGWWRSGAPARGHDLRSLYDDVTARFARLGAGIRQTYEGRVLLLNKILRLPMEVLTEVTLTEH